MNRAWAWIVAAVGALLALLAGAAWWRQRQRAGELSTSAADLAVDNARRAREQAQARIDKALDDGKKAVAAADAKAAREASNGGDLADCLDDLNRGARGRL